MIDINRCIAVVPFWQRHKVTEIFVQNAKDIGLRFIAVCSYGDQENIDLLEGVAEKVLIHNNVAGEKWNYGVSYLALLDDWDFMMVLGSDDLVSKEYFNLIPKTTKYFGLLDALAIDLNTKKVRYWAGYTNHRRGETIGPARVVSKKIVESAHYHLFDDVEKGNIDGSFNRNTGVSAEWTKSRGLPLRVGLKSSSSDITSELAGCSYSDVNYEALKLYYSDKVVEMIREYC